MDLILSNLISLPGPLSFMQSAWGAPCPAPSVPIPHALWLPAQLTFSCRTDEFSHCPQGSWLHHHSCCSSANPEHRSGRGGANVKAFSLKHRGNSPVLWLKLPLIAHRWVNLFLLVLCCDVKSQPVLLFDGIDPEDPVQWPTHCLGNSIVCCRVACCSSL